MTSAVSLIENLRFLKRISIMGAGAGFRGEAVYAPKPETLYYIDFDYFRKAGSIPKLGEGYWLVPVEKINRNESLLVYISHTWLRIGKQCPGWGGFLHPDNEFGEKYKICVEGVQKIWAALGAGFSKCYIWIDYSCLIYSLQSLENQHDLEDKDFLQQRHFSELMDRVIQNSDCMFTPIVDEKSQSWSLVKPVEDWYDQYESFLWKDDRRIQEEISAEKMKNFASKLADRVHFSSKVEIAGSNESTHNSIRDRPMPYLQSGWCRIQMYCAANIPLFESLDRIRLMKFAGSLRIHYSGGKRPHFIFGSKDLQDGAAPHVLPHMDNEYFLRMYHPAQGTFYDESHRALVRQLVKKTTALIPDSGYEGEMVDGLYHGYGKYIWPNGDMYLGQWNMGRKHGKGKYMLANGSIYDGNYVNDVNEGKGTFRYYNGDIFESAFNHDNKNGFGITKYANGTRFEGEYKANIRNGLGAFSLPNGDIYRGHFVNEKMHGKGSYEYANGDIYTGDFKDDRKHGYGLFHYANSDEYEGEFSDDLKHGRGIYTYASGSVYTGEYEADMMSGYGVFTHFSGDKYEGEFKSNQRHGKGKQTYKNGSVYEGLFEKDVAMEEARGKMEYLNGDLYEGDLRGDQKHGNGCYKYANGDTYVGMWAHGKKNGKGKLTYATGGFYDGDFVDDIKTGDCFVQYSSRDTFKGQYKDGKKNGFGVSTLSSGDSYEGEFVDNISHGHGILRKSNGDSFDGEFVDGKFHMGRYFYAATGESYRGPWSNGKRHGKGVYTYGNGNIFEGEFVAGLKQGPGVLNMVTGDHIGRLEGLWKDDEIISGILKFNNGDVYTGEFVAGSFSRGEFFCALSGDTHHGEWINGLKHGQGHTVYRSKDEYEGEFGLGLKQGFGRYTYYSSGDKYEGEWQNDQLHGQGTYTYSCGEVYRGEYRSGKKHGLGMYYFEDGAVMKANWENDELVEELPLEEEDTGNNDQAKGSVSGRIDRISTKNSAYDTEGESIATNRSSLFNYDL